jgi:glycosyl transferase family 25
MHILNKCFDKIYVITIEGSFRIERMKERLNGIDYEFFYGVNGATLDKTPYIQMGSKQTRGQLGCTLSHYNLYKKIVNENLYDKVLILEDDSIFTDNLNELEKYMKQLPQDWGMFYLGWDGGGNIKPNFSPNLCEISNNNLFVLHCTHAISIRPWFAQKMLELNKNALYTADGSFTEIVKQFGVKTYAAIPKIINPDNMESITCNIDRDYGF